MHQAATTVDLREQMEAISYAPATERLINPLSAILVSFLLLLPLFPTDVVKFYTLPLALLFVYQCFVMREWRMPSNPALLIFLFSEAYALVLHADSARSLQNNIGTIFGFAAIYIVIWKTVQIHGFADTERMMFRLLAGLSLLLFPASTVLTALHYPTAPPNFFWHADSETGVRLLLMRGGNGADMDGAIFGHSDVIWSIGFALLLNEKFRRGAETLGPRWFGHMFLLMIGVATLIFSGARIALLVLLEVLLLFLAYRGILAVRLFAVLNVAMVAFYLMLALSTPASVMVGDLLAPAQQAVPMLRLTGGGADDTQSTSLLTGRSALNEAFVNEAGRDPWVGQGHDAPILLYGVTKSGDIAESADQVASSSESGLSLAVTYGYPYFALQMLFMAWPLLRAIRKKSVDAGLSCAVAGVVLLTFVSEGGFANWYSTTVLLGMMTILYCQDETEPIDAVAPQSGMLTALRVRA